MQEIYQGMFSESTPRRQRRKEYWEEGEVEFSVKIPVNPIRSSGARMASHIFPELG